MVFLYNIFLASILSKFIRTSIDIDLFKLNSYSELSGSTMINISFFVSSSSPDSHNLNMGD